MGRWPFDAVSVLSIYLFLLFVIPSRLVVSALGAAGTPAQLWGLGMLCWWAADRISAARSGRPTSPVVRMAGVLVIVVLISYVAATTRAIEPVELRAADRSLLSLFSWLGVLLVVAEGVRTRARFDVLIRRLVLAGGALATLGIVQFITNRGWVDLIQIPGLTLNTDLVSVSSRSSFARPAGTAIHPIEFGVTLTIILPFAIHLALQDTTRAWVRRWFPVAAITFGIPISVSRSAVLGTITVLLVLLPTWSLRRRINTALIVAVAVSLIYVVVPGMLGTFVGLFVGVGSDGSALSRTDSYSLAFQFISQAPVFGRGLGTFLPTYRILDNQYLGIVIEMGFVGLIAVLLLFATGIRSAIRVRRSIDDESTRQLAQCMIAGIAAAAVSFATFDIFSFPMAASMTFFVLGMVPALARLGVTGTPAHTAPTRRKRAQPRIATPAGQR